MQPGATSPKRDEICKRSIGVVPHDEDEEFSKRQRYWHGAGPLSNSRIIVGRGHYRNAVASGRRVDTHNEQTRRYRVTVLTSSKTITLLFISLTPASRRGNRRDGGRRRCRDNGASGARSSRCDSFRSSSRWGPGRGRSSLSTPTLCRGI